MRSKMINIQGIYNKATVYTDNLEPSAESQLRAMVDQPFCAGSRTPGLRVAGFPPLLNGTQLIMLMSLRYCFPKTRKPVSACRNVLIRREHLIFLIGRDGTFDQLRVFGYDRIPTLDIDYGKHWGKKSLHVPL